MKLSTSSDARKKEAKYIQKVLKEEEKEKYQRKVLDYKPSGYMTRQEYEALSEYKDKTQEKIEIPKVVNESDMKYVPQPTYRIVRYNDPPGSPELSIKKSFYKLHQYNGQGISAPDYSIMAYPVVYYYPNSASTASDIFVIPLETSGTNLDKIMKANVQKRLSDPILSTEKSIDNNSAFRTLTPVDFSEDSTKLLVKEKVGSSQDGIWRTDAIVYDFTTKTSYKLVELRDAIAYYWKENKNLDLEDSRWDIYPLGFLQNEPDRVAAYAYAYTGGKPIFLGIWSTDIHGEQSRLISFNMNDIQISVNGFKIIQDGVVKPIIVESEQNALKKSEKLDAKAAKAKEKADIKAMKDEYKATIKEMDADFKEKTSDYNKLQRIKGTTSFNDIPTEYREVKIKDLQKTIKSEEKKLNREQKKIEKLDKKLNKNGTQSQDQTNDQSQSTTEPAGL